MSQDKQIDVFIGMGSNVGDRLNYLQQATELMSEQEGVELLKASSVYETEPWGEPDQDEYLNCVLKLQSSLEALELLHQLKSIEKQIGRKERKKWGPREIDLDILFYGDEIISTDELTVPQENMRVRRFILVPLVEIAPDLKHPEFAQTMNDLLAICPDMGRVKLTEHRLNI
ncbi:MAG: 2-amino-4-hydroxy-6-hydroxymethyldihydropteridine diphosphokinase [Ectothiorhodospiraceae bacterium]|nr:2-amino-4-hydroxy-6-hydroxymethyldihydropteridine diphosphokinase [Ectothiorhodospiraceae bacterium]